MGVFAWGGAGGAVVGVSCTGCAGAQLSWTLVNGMLRQVYQRCMQGAARTTLGSVGLEAVLWVGLLVCGLGRVTLSGVADAA